MIDSIVLRVHDLRTNEALVHYLHKQGIQGKETRVRELQEPYKPERELLMKRYYVDYDTGNSYAQGYHSHLKSYVYDIAYFINFNRDYIEFNFSVPKYLYGNNLMQSVAHLYDNNFHEYKERPYYSLRNNHWNFFRKAINYFLNTEFNEVRPPKHTIQISSIDLAFNLFFKDKKDLNFYLSYLMSIRKKHFRASSDQGVSRKNSMHFSGDLHTLKIYHKGLEFEAHDYRKIKKRFGKNVANEILKIADNVLRLEVSFKSRGLSYYYLSRLAPTYYRKAYKLYKNYHKDGQFIYEGKKYQKGDKVEKHIKQLLVDGKKLNSKLVNFYFDIDDETNQERFDFMMPFTYDMYSHLIQRFKEITSRYHLGKWQNFEFLKNQMSQFNVDLDILRKSNQKFNEKTLLVFHELLRTKSWDEIIQGNYFSRSTIYKYKKLFASIGYREVNAELPVSAVDYTYATYYRTIVDKLAIISKRNKLPFEL